MPTTGPVVAVLDDEPEMRKALRRLLTCRGFRVEEYERGEDLLAALGSRPLNYLLLDLMELVILRVLGLVKEVLQLIQKITLLT